MFVRTLLSALLAAPAVLAGPVSVTLFGNFGPSDSNSTIFDNQNFSVTFTIADPAVPSSAAPDASWILYDMVPAHLTVPGLSLTIDRALSVGYNQASGFGTWMNVMSFEPLPVGDYLVFIDVHPVSGAPVWNGLAGALGTPALSLFNAEPATGTWYLEQDMIPLATYSNGPTFLTSSNTIPEPSTVALVAGAVLALVCRKR